MANAFLGCVLVLLFLCLVYRKFIGLELAALIQLGYLSLLTNKAITTYAYPIYQLQYVFGYNKLYFSPLPSERFRSSYALFGYQLYFGFSNNLMAIVTGGVYALALSMLFCSRLGCESTARRLRKAAYTVSEAGYTLTVFCTPNIVTALCIEASEGAVLEGPVWSIVCAAVSVSSIVFTHLFHSATAESWC